MRRAFSLLVLAALPAFAQPAPQPQPAALPAPVFHDFATVAVYPQREAPAAVVSRNESRIAAELPAVVLEMNAEVGEVVAKGSVLARLDPRDYELALARARAAEESTKARLALAEAQLKRARELKAEGFISADALLQRETELAVVAAELKSAAAALATARHNLDKCVIRAPYRAIVRSRGGQVGELAGSGVPLYTLTEAERLEVAAQVPAREASDLAQAKDFHFVGQDGHFALALLRISPAIDRAARTREVRLAFKGKAPLPGAEGRLEWRDAQAHLPAEYLLRRGKELGVFLNEAGKARFLPLPEAQEGRPVRAALAPSARVAGAGRHALSDGQALTPVGAVGGK
ncbi:MAG: efflux RND transporter periplasmic adaptor subunit [Betaproteobacteria bacterium]|nr:efflux RND transporter periplasmic adaptor subunit [Betaproteobacteria bacterium]